MRHIEHTRQGCFVQLIWSKCHVDLAYSEPCLKWESKRNCSQNPHRYSNCEFRTWCGGQSRLNCARRFETLQVACCADHA